MGFACSHYRPNTFDRFLNLCHCDERTFLTRRKFRFSTFSQNNWYSSANYPHDYVVTAILNRAKPCMQVVYRHLLFQLKERFKKYNYFKYSRLQLFLHKKIYHMVPYHIIHINLKHMILPMEYA